MGQSTISMAIFNSYVKLPEGNTKENHDGGSPRICLSSRSNWTVHLDDYVATRHMLQPKPTAQRTIVTASNIRFRFIISYPNQWLASVVSVSPSSMAQMNFASCGCFHSPVGFSNPHPKIS
jgi:hypothetical protein